MIRMSDDPPQPPAGHHLTPLGLAATYLTIGDLLPPPAPGLEHVVLRLAAIPIERTLDWVGRMLAPSGLGGTSWAAHQQTLAAQWFDQRTSAGAKARSLVVSGQRILLAPQVLLLLARLALEHGSRRSPSDEDRPAPVSERVHSLIEAMLMLAHHMGAQRRHNDDRRHDSNGVLVLGDDKVTDLEVALAANILMNRRPHPASVFDRFARRWLEIPTEGSTRSQAVDLVGEFEAGTGVALGDMTLVASALWARTIGDRGPRAGSDELQELGLRADRVNRVLSLIGGTVDELRQESRNADQALDPEFDISLFSRRPVIRLANGGLLVVSPTLLLERAFGWLPRWDMTGGLEAQRDGGRKRAARALGLLQETTEIHAVESLTAAGIAGAVSNVYSNDAIQAAFGTKAPNADCALAWPEDWVVAEVSSRPVGRQTAGAASAAALIDEMNKSIENKARQLDGTIAAIRADEELLTDAPMDLRHTRRFWPLLVTSEGFPVYPLLNFRIRAMLREAGYLTGSDTADLIVLDTEALEAVEAVGQAGGPSLPLLLAEHAASDMSDFGFKEWLLITHSNRVPTRVLERWHRALDPVLEALRSHANRDPLV